MARCKSCSAPLPSYSNRCTYCGIRNDVDLHGKHHFSINSHESERICPDCDKPLQTIELKLKNAFEIERCSTCFGLFFDPGEIETLLESSVSGVFEINLQHLTNINKDRYLKDQKVKYVKCPVCRIMMSRVNFGKRSGVIIDQCRNHGIWLNSGEITHLMEWKKVGGQLLHKQQIVRDKAKRPQRSFVSSNETDAYHVSQRSSDIHVIDEDLFDTVSSVIYKLFN